MSVMIAEVLGRGKKARAEYHERSKKPHASKQQRSEVIIVLISALGDHGRNIQALRKHVAEF